jgi:hypothetical protein
MIEVEFTVLEVETLCGVSRRTVRNWIDEGKFPSAHFRYDSPKMGYLIPAKDLLGFIARTNPMILPRAERMEKAKAEEMLAAC